MEIKNKRFIGAHQSIAGGVYNALLKASELQTDTVQIFTKNSNRWIGKNISAKDRLKFTEFKESLGIKHIIAHSAYLINLASPELETLEKSKKCLIQDIDNCLKLNINYLVLHPGSHKGAGEEKGIATIAQSLNEILENYKDQNITILLETTAGQGSSVGCKIEHLKNIYELVYFKNQLGFCLDTCHLFAAGYDFRTENAYKQLKQQLQSLDLKKIRAIHLNDSKKNLNSRVDRHEHIGKGKIGLEPFSYFLNDIDFTNIPFILETPKENNMDEVNLNTLKSLIK